MAETTIISSKFLNRKENENESLPVQCNWSVCEVGCFVQKVINNGGDQLNPLTQLNKISLLLLLSRSVNSPTVRERRGTLFSS